MSRSAGEPHGSPRNGSRPTVLIVEDEVLIRLMVADELRDAGYNVIEASDGDEALSIFDLPIPLDLVLTDVRMPGSIDGIALLGLIRSKRPYLPVIVMSGHLEPRLALSEGAIEFLAKPFALDAAVEAVRAALEELNGR